MRYRQNLFIYEFGCFWTFGDHFRFLGPLRQCRCSVTAWVGHMGGGFDLIF